MLLQELDRFGKMVERNIVNLNCGGCCIFAVLVAKELEEYVTGVRIAVFDDEGGNIDKARANINDAFDIKEWHNNGVYFGHVKVEFRYKRKMYFFDTEDGCTREKTSMGIKLLPGRFSVEEAESFANTRGAWNQCFNRTKEVPRLKRMVRRFFTRLSKMDRDQLLERGRYANRTA